jgi:Ca-activated chloride channel family protein
MSLTLGAPVFLLLLVPLAGLVAVAQRWGQPGPMWPSALRVGCVTALVLALAQPAWSRPGGGAPVVLVDRSASVTPPMRAKENRWLGALRRAAPGTEVLNFAGAAEFAGPAGPQSGAGAGVLDAGNTDIQAAVQLALGWAGDGRLVVISDGLETEGSVLAAAGEARRQGTPIDVVPLAEGGRDAAVTRVQAPAAVRLGDGIPVLVTIHAMVAARARLSLSEDGSPTTGSVVHLHRGDNPFLFNLQAGTRGWHSFLVKVRLRGDELPLNDALWAVTHVGRPPRLLYVEADHRGHPSFPAFLPRLGLSVRVTTPRALAARPGAFDGLDAVVLDDLPTGALGRAQLDALTTAVRAKGLGLLVLGGPRSLTAGWYAGTPLSRALPVVGTGTNGKGAVALELVLDRSGSMIDLAGYYPKIVMAKAAASVAVDFARRNDDYLGVVAFDSRPHLIVPVRRVTGAAAAAADRSIDTLTPNGGTDIYRALRMGLDQIRKSPAPLKQIILMTDGRGVPANYGPLLSRLQADHATLSSVALGQDADQRLLRHLSAVGGGGYHYTANAHDLPGIFAREARRGVRPAHVAGRISTALASDVAAVRSLLGTRLAPVRGYVATRLLPGAVADVVADRPGYRSDPLLAQWQYGLGRVAVWTPGVQPGSAGAWATNGGLWDDLVRWLQRGVSTPALWPHLVWSGGHPTVEVDTLANAGLPLDLADLVGSMQPPRGAPRVVAFQQVGPSRYRAALPDRGPGVYRVVVRQLGAPGRSVDAAVAVPYPPEYLPGEGGRALLARLAALTGGHLLADSGRAAAWERAHVGRHTVRLWWALTLLALALFLGGVLTRLDRSAPRPGQHREPPERQRLSALAVREGEHEQPGTYRAEEVDR